MNILRVRVRHRTWVGCVCARACTLTCGSYHLSVNAVAVECHFIVHHLPSFLLPAARRVGFVCNNALGHPIHRPPDAPSCTVCVCVCSYSVVHFGSLHSHEFVCVYVDVGECEALGSHRARGKVSTESRWRCHSSIIRCCPDRQSCRCLRVWAGCCVRQLAGRLIV